MASRLGRADGVQIFANKGRVLQEVSETTLSCCRTVGYNAPERACDATSLVDRRARRTTLILRAQGCTPYMLNKVSYCCS